MTRTLIRLIYILPTPSGKGIDETSISDKFITIYHQAENWTTFWVDVVLELGEFHKIIFLKMI